MSHLLQKDFEEIFQNSRKIFGELAGSRLFITGGTGFFGKWLLGALQHANQVHDCKIDVVALTRDIRKFKVENPDLLQSRLSFIESDIRGLAGIEASFDFLIHGATPAKLTEQSPEELVSIIVQGTQSFLKFAEKAKGRRLLYISSGAVYGPQSPLVNHLSEDQLLPPLNVSQNAYGLGKQKAEELVSAFGESANHSVSIARCFAFVGPHLPLDQHFAIGNFIRNCIENKDIVLSGDGTARRSYLYAGDLVTWLLSLLVMGESQRVYNVGSQISFSIEEIAQKVKRVWLRAEYSQHRLREPAIQILSKLDPLKPIHRYVPSTVRSSSELGLQEWTSLEEGIARTFNFLLSSR